MGRIKEKMDQELSGMTFSNRMMEQVLEQTCRSTEESKREEEQILRILDVVQKEPMSGFEILMKLTEEAGQMGAEVVNEKELYPFLHRMTEQQSSFLRPRGGKTGKSGCSTRSHRPGEAERALWKGRRADKESDQRGLCHGEG